MENLFKKLMTIQTALKAPKNQYNSFGKYSYRSCEDILEAVKPLLKQTELVLTISDDIVMAEGRHYIKATCRITDGEKEISVSAFAREEDSKAGMSASQITGSASSYARKYALNGLFCIDDAKDADAQAPEAPKKKSKAKPQPVEYKCAECGKVFEGCTPEMFVKVQAASPDGVARCKECRAKLSRQLDEEAAKEDNNA